MPDSLKWFPGLGDLLKVRGIRKLGVVVPSEYSYSRSDSFDEEVSLESIINDLQVLKLPRSAASLRRQDDKDFPIEKARRTSSVELTLRLVRKKQYSLKKRNKTRLVTTGPAGFSLEG